MSEWKDLARFMYGDVKEDTGFWYAHPLWEIEGLSEEQLFWVPDKTSLCMLWHVGHIAHRERSHFAYFLEGLKVQVVPPQYEVFGTEWHSVDEVRKSIDSVQGVFNWVREVRQKSQDFIEKLDEKDFHLHPTTSESGLSIAQWIFITVSHWAIHIGRIQMLRAMLKGKPDQPC